MITITQELAGRSRDVEELLDDAFGPARRRKTCYLYRAGIEPVAPLCLMALHDTTLIGTIRYWPIAVGGELSVLLGPVAVAAEYRNVGLGGRLIRRSLERAAGLGYRSAVLVGDEGYYRRFGFRPGSLNGIVMPGQDSARLLALSLAREPGAALPSGSIECWLPADRTAIAV
jgi:predicted N-acetyltransferase YhbS